MQFNEFFSISAHVHNRRSESEIPVLNLQLPAGLLSGTSTTSPHRPAESYSPRTATSHPRWRYKKNHFSGDVLDGFLCHFAAVPWKKPIRNVK
jgi:hypothetical protein